MRSPGLPPISRPSASTVDRPRAQSDLWALGVVLYEALAGRKPFDGATPLAVAVAVRDDSPTPLPEVRPDVDPTVAAAVATAMSAAPEQRFATAADMAAALRGEAATPTIVDGTVVDGTVMLPAPAVRTHRLSRRMAVLAGAGAVVLLLVGLGLFAGRDRSPEVPAQPVSASVTTTAPPTSTTISAAVPVQNVGPAPVTRVRRGAKGKKGKND